ncbi:MAG: hypothetical protein KatS3mg053_1672 [Candidatus Roseilinea sp.]|nr:MAG: hypothetical protein KatS3mg053_1672 [Candidatus Roseilinea sp.]
MQRNKPNCTSSRAYDGTPALQRVMAIIVVTISVLVPGHVHHAAHAQSLGDFLIYGNHLADPWQNWSWNTTIDFANAAPALDGSAASIAITYDQPWAGALFGTNSPMATAGYTAIAFWMYGTAPVTHIRVFAKHGSTGQDTSAIELTVPGGAWREVIVPFSQLGNPESISAIAIQEGTGAIQPTFFVDDLRLISSAIPTLEDIPANESNVPPALEPISNSDTILSDSIPEPAPEADATSPDVTSEGDSDKSTTCCAEFGHRMYLPLTLQPSSDPSASLGEFDGPTLSLTMTLDGHVHLAWTAVPDAIFYNLKYSVGDRSETMQLTDNQWVSDSLFVADAGVATFSVAAITSQGISRESNVVSLELLNGTVLDLDTGSQVMQPASTAADCRQLVQHLLYRIYTLEDTPTQKRDREMWVYAGPVQCLNLLASELELMGALNRWNCELMLRPYGFSQPPATSAWIEKFWRKAIAGAGSSQICRQLKMNPLNLSANVSALRNAANSCVTTGAVKWTLQMDTILTIEPGSVTYRPFIVQRRYLFSVYDVLCVRPKPIRYFTSRRIVYTDDTFDNIDPNAIRSAIRDLTLTSQPLAWTKTEAIAHRGDRVSSPDNTNEAIKRAMEKGARYIEVDTQLASDGKVIIAHGSLYKPHQGFTPDVPTQVYGPTAACHNKNMEVDVTPFLTGNCDIGTQMALASEGASWLPKFKGERYLLLQNVVTDARYRDYCGWFVEMKNSEHPTENKAQRNKRLGEAVQAILLQSGVVERCASRRQNVWVTSFEDSALDGVVDDRIYKLRVVSRLSLINWVSAIDNWLAKGYDGVAIDLAVADTLVESKPLPEYIRRRGLRVVAYTLIPGSQNQGTNQTAIDRKLDFFLTDILDDLLIRNGDKSSWAPLHRISLPREEARAIVIRNYEAYPVIATLSLDGKPLPITPNTTSGDSWLILPFEPSPTNPDMLIVEQTEVVPYMKPAYETPHYTNILYYKSYLVGQKTVSALVQGGGQLDVVMQHNQHSNVKPRLVSVGADRAQFAIRGVTMPTIDGRNEIAICQGETVSVSGRLIPASGWLLKNSVPVQLMWDGQFLSASGAALRPTFGKHELRIVGRAYDAGLIEPRALNQERPIMLRITVNVVPKTSGCG